MESGFGVEDLFQDDSAPRTPPRRIDSRIDELRLSGCNQYVPPSVHPALADIRGRKIAWSKLGSIAIINAAGTGVETRHLSCSPEDGRWLLSDAYPVANVARYHEGQPLTHVTWNSHGAELAVMDRLGRVSFYTVFLAVNHLNVTRSQILDQDDDLCALVGFWWLPVERAVCIPGGEGRERGREGSRIEY